MRLLRFFTSSAFQLIINRLNINEIMNEQELFNIQHEQLNEEIAKINWISDNKEKLIRDLRKVVANCNAEYFDDENLDVSTIFRGMHISTWIDNYVSSELLKEVTDK